MASWQERMRQADELRQAAEALRAKDLEQKRLNQQKLKQKEEEGSRNWKEGLRKIAKSFRIEELLGQIRSEVWKDGSVETNETFGYHIELSYKYYTPEYGKRDAGSLLHGNSYEYYPTGKNVEKETSLEVEIHEGRFYWIEGQKWEYREGLYLQVRDSEVELAPVMGADKYANSYGSTRATNKGFGMPPDSPSRGGTPIMHHLPQAIDIKDERAQAILEEALLRSCIIRRQGDLLPFQLKQKSDSEIYEVNRTKKPEGSWISRLIYGK